MQSTKKMQEILSIILVIGIWISTALVLIGGILFLIKHRNENLDMILLPRSEFQLSLSQILQFAFSFTPLGIVELGLLILVATQILRVILLTFFYIKIRDSWFTFFSLFILIVLIYSFIWRS